MLPFGARPVGRRSPIVPETIASGTDTDIVQSWNCAPSFMDAVYIFEKCDIIESDDARGAPKPMRAW